MLCLSINWGGDRKSWSDFFQNLSFHVIWSTLVYLLLLFCFLNNSILFNPCLYKSLSCNFTTPSHNSYSAVAFLTVWWYLTDTERSMWDYTTDVNGICLSYMCCKFICTNRVYQKILLIVFLNKCIHSKFENILILLTK